MRCYILGLGHPRTGTKFTAEVLRAMGLDIGHEKMGNDGIVAWPLVYDTGPWPWVSRLPNEGVSPQRLVYNVRSPHRSITSIVYTDDKTEKTLEWRKKRLGIPGRGEFDNRVEYAIMSILRFDEIIMSKGPDLVYRIEDQVDSLVKMVQEDWGSQNLKEYYGPGVVNSRKYDDEEDSLDGEFEAVRHDLREGIDNYCVRHGYPKIFS